jgi:hypothetical protein
MEKSKKIHFSDALVQRHLAEKASTAVILVEKLQYS